MYNALSMQSISRSCGHIWCVVTSLWGAGDWSPQHFWPHWQMALTHLCVFEAIQDCKQDLLNGNSWGEKMLPHSRTTVSSCNISWGGSAANMLHRPLADVSVGLMKWSLKQKVTCMTQFCCIMNFGLISAVPYAFNRSLTTGIIPTACCRLLI